MRKEKFVTGEYYHVYNRGVDKRSIIQDQSDCQRFLQGLTEFNTLEPIGSIFENSYKKDRPNSNLVDIVAFCLNPNHFHLLLFAKIDDGISKFMHRLSTGHTKYFNEKYVRSGSLFQGVFKARHVSDDEYFLYLSAYINLNDRVHQLGSEASKLVRSSWDEYLSSPKNRISTPEHILNQFNNVLEYKKFSEDSLKLMLEHKQEEKELKELFHE